MRWRGGALPCVWIPDEMGEYDYALTVVPGETLRFIYEKIWQPDSGSERSLISEPDGGKSTKGFVTLYASSLSVLWLITTAL